MILASSNFDAEYYNTHLAEEDVSDAWLAKVKQCYQKAKLTLQEDESFAKIDELYQEIMQKINKGSKQKSTKNKIATILLSFFVPLALIWISILLLTNPSFDPNAIPIGISYEEVEGQHYQDVIELLEENGFSNVEAREDDWHLFHKSGTVKSVTVNGKSTFFAFSKFSKNAKIIVFYYK